MPGDVFIHHMPLFHTTGCAILVLGGLGVGATMLLAPIFEPEMILRVTERESPRFILGVPTMIVTLIDEAEKSRFISYLEEQLLSFIKQKILKLSVLDPAMGSGHFLVNATNKIANFIAEFLNEYELSSEQTTSTTYWRRRVVDDLWEGVC